jgi:5-hydroxyisourate hydrolase
VSGISTHILDTSRGLPATGVPVQLEVRDGPGWRAVNGASTDVDGRIKALLPVGTSLAAGVYRLRFETGAYFGGLGVKAFFPVVEVVFEVADATRHHHVPLLLSPFGYSTYRGT